MRQKLRHTSIVVTTTTPESASLIENSGLASLQHHYLCYDLPFFVSRLIRAIDPQVLLVIETELWLNLYAKIGAQGIPLSIVNARLSARTLSAAAPLKAMARDALKHCQCILAKSAADADGYRSLGADQKKIRVLGNLKFAALTTPATVPLTELHQINYWLAASTHDPEEKILAEIIAAKTGRRPLVLAPRHPARSKEIETLLRARGLSIAVRTRGETPNSTTDVYLADTTGEMDALIAGASFVFVGGSLAKSIGGHNLLEVAARNKPVVSGSSLYNFTDEAALLRQADALIEVNSKTELADVVDQLLQSTELREKKGIAAGHAVAAAGNCIDAYLREIDKLVD